jgi:uncharacterized membrane protein YecN with MAPEG domain
MIEFPVTLTATCVLRIAYAGLSVAVGRQRGQANVSLGNGSDLSIAIGEEYKAPPLLVAIRRHAQFAEYVPISVVLLLALELNHANRVMLAGLAAMLVMSRTCMAMGLGRTTPNPLRTAGNLLQWGMILIASAVGLMLAIGLNQ